MKPRIVSFVLLAACAWAAPLGAQQFVDLPVGSWVNDITPDGTIVVGTWELGDGFLWRWQTEPAPTIIPGGDVVGVSDDGSVLVGNVFDSGVGATVAALWTETGGWQVLDWLPGAPCGSSYSTAYDISGDGTTVVGLGWDGCSAHGFRWTAATGVQALELLANGTNRCSTISGDGSALGGFAQGNFTRTPAYWDASTAGAVIDASIDGEVFGFTEDGSLSVGTYRLTGDVYHAFVRDAGTGVITNLGNLTGGWDGQARDISEDGSVIVGNDVNGLARRAWVWTASDGMISVNDRLDALGITGVDDLFVCRAVSDDGKVVVGGGVDGGGGPFGFGGFIFALDGATWTNLGGGSSGINGVPTLAGSGTLVGGTPVSLDLTDAPANALTLLWISLASSPLNVFGGTLHALPFSDQFLLGTDVDGHFAASTPWPVGIPSGTEAWFQFLVADPSVIFGITLSNAVKATTP